MQELNTGFRRATNYVRRTTEECQIARKGMRQVVNSSNPSLLLLSLYNKVGLATNRLVPMDLPVLKSTELHWSVIAFVGLSFRDVCP